jgi:hypothetical protein
MSANEALESFHGPDSAKLKERKLRRESGWRSDRIIKGKDYEQTNTIQYNTHEQGEKALTD